MPCNCCPNPTNIFIQIRSMGVHACWEYLVPWTLRRTSGKTTCIWSLTSCSSLWCLPNIIARYLHRHTRASWIALSNHDQGMRNQPLNMESVLICQRSRCFHLASLSSSLHSVLGLRLDRSCRKARIRPTVIQQRTNSGPLEFRGRPAAERRRPSLGMARLTIGPVHDTFISQRRHVEKP